MFCCNVIHILATYEKAKKYLDLFLLTSPISTDDMQHDETENRSSKRKLVYANSFSGFFIVNILELKAVVFSRVYGGDQG